MSVRVRFKPEDILWPINQRTVEAINYNFDVLFTDLYRTANDDSILPVTRGGTGESSWGTGELIYAAAPDDLAGLPDVATGNVLLSGGVDTAPLYGKVGLTTHVTGILPIANGGTSADNKTDAFDNLSPLTTIGQLLTHDGTHNVALPAGTHGQFLRVQPDLSVAWETVPLAGLTDYFLTDTASDIGGYKEAAAANPGPPQVDTTVAGLGSGVTLIEEWATPAGGLGLTFLPDGIFHLHLHVEKTAGTKTLTVFARAYLRDAGSTETLLCTTEESSVITAETDIDLEAPFPETVVALTDRIVMKLYADVTGLGSAPTLVYEIAGPTLSRIEFPVTAGAAAVTGGPHAFLSTTHSDTKAASAVRGDLVQATYEASGGETFWLDGLPNPDLIGADETGQRFWLDGLPSGTLTTGLLWRRHPIGPANTFLRSNGSEAEWGPVGDLPYISALNQPRAKAYRNTNVSITNGASGAGVDPAGWGGYRVSLQVESFDIGGFWDVGTPSRMTVPAGQAGTYLVIGQASWATSATGRKAAWIYHTSGTTTARRAITEVNGDDGGLGLSFNVSTFLVLAAGDYVELWVRQDSAGAVNLLGGADDLTQLQLIRLS